MRAFVLMGSLMLSPKILGIGLFISRERWKIAKGRPRLQKLKQPQYESLLVQLPSKKQWKKHHSSCSRHPALKGGLYCQMQAVIQKLHQLQTQGPLDPRKRWKGHRSFRRQPTVQRHNPQDN